MILNKKLQNYVMYRKQSFLRFLIQIER